MFIAKEFFHCLSIPLYLSILIWVSIYIVQVEVIVNNIVIIRTGCTSFLSHKGQERSCYSISLHLVLTVSSFLI